MCGRFVSASPPDEIARYFGAVPPETTLEENYNVAPTNEVYAVRADAGHRADRAAALGPRPPWAKDLRIGSKMINARSETVATKPAFRKAYSSRRCLVPADALLRVAEDHGVKNKAALPHQPGRRGTARLRRSVGAVGPEGRAGRMARRASDVESCTIITTEAEPDDGADPRSDAGDDPRRSLG